MTYDESPRIRCAAFSAPASSCSLLQDGRSEDRTAKAYRLLRASMNLIALRRCDLDLAGGRAGGTRLPADREDRPLSWLVKAWSGRRESNPRSQFGRQ
jgi:hypothetical protein